MGAGTAGLSCVHVGPFLLVPRAERGKWGPPEREVVSLRDDVALLIKENSANRCLFAPRLVGPSVRCCHVSTASYNALVFQNLPRRDSRRTAVEPPNWSSPGRSAPTFVGPTVREGWGVGGKIGCVAGCTSGGQHLLGNRSWMAYLRVGLPRNPTSRCYHAPGRTKAGGGELVGATGCCHRARKRPICQLTPTSTR